MQKRRPGATQPIANENQRLIRYLGIGLCGFGALEDLTLTFGTTGNYQPGSFTASGAPEYFHSDATSTWQWANGSTEMIVQLPDLSPVSEIIIEELTETSLTIGFQFSDPVSEGRVQGIGEYRVSLTRQ